MYVPFADSRPDSLQSARKLASQKSTHLHFKAYSEFLLPSTATNTFLFPDMILKAEILSMQSEILDHTSSLWTASVRETRSGHVCIIYRQ